MRFLFCEGKDKQTNVIAKKTAGKASVKDGNTTKRGIGLVDFVNKYLRYFLQYVYCTFDESECTKAGGGEISSIIAG